MVVQGHYNGFRLVDVTFPSRPKEIIDYEECAPKNADGRRSRKPGRHRHLREHPQPLVELEHGCGGSIL